MRRNSEAGPAEAWTRRRLGLLLPLLALGGCSGPAPPPPPPPGVVMLDITAASNNNPDREGRPSPVVVRVYQLGAPTKFTQSDYFQLFEHESAALGPDLVGRDELEIAPRETKKLTIPLKPSGRFIGIAVSYRDIAAASWRTLSEEVPPSGTTVLTATLRSLTVTLEKARP